MRHTLIAGIAALLLWSPPAHAVVSCTNENTAVQATTPTADFMLDATDGTATHTSTGLVWMRCALGQAWDGSACTGTAAGYEWQPALQVAQNVNTGASNDDNDNATGFAGETDWRLPNKNELASIIEPRCWTPAINAAVFPVPSGTYWTSSPYISSTAEAWVVQFSSGTPNSSLKSSSFQVRLVRGGR